MKTKDKKDRALSNSFKFKELTIDDIQTLHDIIDWWERRHHLLIDQNPKRNNIRCTFHVDTELIYRFRQVAQQNNISQSELLNRLLEANFPDDS